MKLFLDTNVLLDFVMKRIDDASLEKFIALSIDSAYELYCADISITNMIYVLQKNNWKNEDIMLVVHALLEYIHLLSIDEEIYIEMMLFDSLWSDLEDMSQYICSKRS